MSNKTEIEVKYPNIDIEKMRETLKRLGAKLVIPMRQMRRVNFKNAEMTRDKKYIRVRDEGGKIVMTYKCFLHGKYAEEIETTVGDFDYACAIITALGIPQSAYQESRREEWHLDGAEVVIDEWPWVAPYIEIEAETEAQCQSVVKKLGLNWDDALYGAVSAIYHYHYPHICDEINDVPEIRFGLPLPKILQHEVSGGKGGTPLKK